MNKLNLGCGGDIRSGYINMDCVELTGVNVIHDITNIPLPFEDDFFDEVLYKDMLEHKVIDGLKTYENRLFL